MRKLSVLMLLMLFLLTSCRTASRSNDSSETEGLSSATQSETVSEPLEPSVSSGAVSTDGNAELPEAPTDDLPFEELGQKYPIVSECTGIFASRTPTDIIGAGLEAVNAMERGVMQIDASISADLGLLGSSIEQMNVSVTADGDDYSSTVRSTTLSNGEVYTTVESDLYTDGVYYYRYAFEDGQNDFVERCKAAMTAERFRAYLSGNLGVMEDVEEADLGQIAALVDNAFEFDSGMTEDGGCVYYAKGFTVDDLNRLVTLADFDEDMGDYLTEESMANISLAVLMNADGSLRTLYLHLPLEISIESEDLTLSMTVAAQAEMTVRPLTDRDAVDAPADAEDYATVTEEELFG